MNWISRQHHAVQLPQSGKTPVNFVLSKDLLRTTAPALVALAMALAPTAPTLAQDAGKTVATVNGIAITEGDLKLAEDEIGRDLGNLPDPTKRRVLVEFLIENNLFAKAAEGAKLSEGADFDVRMKYWRNRALRDAYFEKEINTSVGEAAAKTYYDDQVKALKTKEEVEARHILVDSEDKAKELKKKIEEGGDFAALAKENSKDPGTKDDGGMLGYFSTGQMVPAFEQAAFALKKARSPIPSRANSAGISSRSRTAARSRRRRSTRSRTAFLHPSSISAPRLSLPSCVRAPRSNTSTRRSRKRSRNRIASRKLSAARSRT